MHGRLPRTGLLIVLAVLHGLCLCGPGGAARATQGNPDVAQQELTIADIRNVGVSARSRIRSIDVETTLHTAPVRDQVDPQGLISDLEERVFVDLVRGRFHWSKRHPDASSDFVETRLAFSGEIETAYSVASGGGLVATRETSNVDIFRKCQFLGAAMLCPRRIGGLGLDDGSFENFMDHATLRGVEEISGRPCHVVDASILREGDREPIRYMSVWLDVERGAMPARLVVYGKGGEEQVVQESSEFETVDLGDGGVAWLPRRIVTATTLSGGRSYRQIYNIRSVAVNVDAADSAFSIEFPPGATVVDVDSGQSFVVPGGLPGEQVVDRRPLSSTPNPKASRRHWFIIANVIGLAIVGLILIVRRIRLFHDS